MSSHPGRPPQAGRPRTSDAAWYERVALANTTMAAINLGFVVFTVASILLSLDPFTGSHAALWPIDELDRQLGDHLITKRRRSAFHDTGLDTLLRDLGVTQVVLATDAMADPDP